MKKTGGSPAVRREGLLRILFYASAIERNGGIVPSAEHETLPGFLEAPCPTMRRTARRPATGLSPA